MSIAAFGAPALFKSTTHLAASRPLNRQQRIVASSASTESSTTSTSTTKLSGPAPQKFAVAEGELNNIATAGAAAAARAGIGAFNVGYKSSIERTKTDGVYTVAELPGGFRIRETSSVGRFPRPAEPIVVYDKHDCPQCRKVREVASLLDLDILFRPCPEGGNVWNSDVTSLPHMQDPNSGMTIAGDADEIVAFLFRTYGNRKIPLMLRLPFGLTAVTAKLGMAPRKGKGGIARPTKATQNTIPLKYYAYEASPFCVVVREVLSELQIPHVQISVARGSPRRQVLLEKVGHFQVPFIEDENTGVAMFESKDIIDYLRKTYGSA